MQKNRLKIKKIRNMILLGMTLIVMLGIYINIRNSRAEDAIQITVNVTDTEGLVGVQTLTLPATVSENGTYQIEVPNYINAIETKEIYLSDETKIEDVTYNKDYTKGWYPIELTSEEVAALETNIKATYTKKEYTNGTETIVCYYRKVSDPTNEVTMRYFMPLNAVINVEQIENASLTNLDLPIKSTIEKAYNISINYENASGQMVEKVYASNGSNRGKHHGRYL